jgi:hypothetical protein
MSGFSDRLAHFDAVFLDNVVDTEIEAAYLAAKSGDKAAYRALTEIAALGWTDELSTTRQIQADRALSILYWFSLGRVK